LLIVFGILAGTKVSPKTKTAPALYDAIADTTIVDTVMIENDKWDTPYIALGYSSYGQAISSDTAPIFNIEIAPCFASISDSFAVGPAATLGVDTLTKSANVDETTWHSLSDYYPANQKYIVRIICAEIDVSDTDSIGVKLYYAKPEKR